MTELLFEGKTKNENMPPNIVNLHTSLFSCYSQSGIKNETDTTKTAPQIGVRVSNFDDDSDVVMTKDGLAVTESSNLGGQKAFCISNCINHDDDNDRRASNLSDETIG